MKRVLRIYDASHLKLFCFSGFMVCFPTSYGPSSNVVKLRLKYSPAQCCIADVYIVHINVLIENLEAT